MMEENLKTENVKLSRLFIGQGKEKMFKLN